MSTTDDATGAKHKDSDAKITLGGAVSMGTGVMIGAGVFALMGQVAGAAGGSPSPSSPRPAWRPSPPTPM